jgi:putative nucleotidyltransferase with HDIG domain
MSLLVMTRRQPLLIPAAALAATGAVAALVSRPEDWTPLVLLPVLLAVAVLGDRYEVESSSHVRVVGSLPAHVLAAVLLGPAPAAAIGVLAVLVEQTWERAPLHRLLVNGFVYATFPLLVGLAVREVGIHDGAAFVLVVAAAFLLAGVLNLFLVALAGRLFRGSGLVASFRSAYVPVISAHLAHALLTAGTAALYARAGVVAIALAGLLLVTYQRLLRDLLRSQANAEAAEEHSRRLARVQFGVVRAKLDSVHARDRMTARHSAAVARYSRSIAEAAGACERDQERVHIAALLHDVGKFIFTDAIFWSAGRLSDEQWALIKRHPEQGADIVGRLDGYADVAEIIRHHHERVDGTGYPRGLRGDEIPALSRMIAVADAYDVMTARDSYRAPISPEEAIAELRRASGSQLDPRFVELFIGLLAEQGVGFRHGDDADFEAELDFERRVRDYAAPRSGVPVAATG